MYYLVAVTAAANLVDLFIISYLQNCYRINLRVKTNIC